MNIYKRHRFPPEVSSSALPKALRGAGSLAVLSFQSQARGSSHRDIEDLLAERGIVVSHESIRLWCSKFEPKYSRRLKRKNRGYGDTFYIDEVFVQINLSMAKWQFRLLLATETNRDNSFSIDYIRFFNAL